MSERTIDHVVDDLSDVIDRCRERKSAAGYFPALYRRVTIGVRDWIRQGRFDDGARMERLDVLFADRYLDAWHAWEAGRPVSRAWRAAFEAADEWPPIVMQHLLLGMNAHINLDLGIAAASVAPAAEIEGLHGDFIRINDILIELVDDVQDRLSHVWPALRVLDWLGDDDDEAIVNFSMCRARDAAWGFARRLAASPRSSWDAAIDLTDEFVADLAGRVRRPGILLGTVVRFVRVGELRPRRRVIDLLS
ncbi:MAG TPA: DUF5995 family protein [Longimicrobiales bacterium]|nr:DUF5995 family protein [Longimicrobiales bacterium]